MVDTLAEAVRAEDTTHRGRGLSNTAWNPATQSHRFGFTESATMFAPSHTHPTESRKYCPVGHWLASVMGRSSDGRE